MRDSSLLSFEKILKEDNTKVMLGFSRIAHSDTGIELFQSENRNVITISFGDFYYHITLEDIVNSVLMDKLESDIKQLTPKQLPQGDRRKG